LRRTHSAMDWWSLTISSDGSELDSLKRNPELLDQQSKFKYCVAIPKQKPVGTSFAKQPFTMRRHQVLLSLYPNLLIRTSLREASQWLNH
jgi:hypothetical protein